MFQQVQTIFKSVVGSFPPQGGGGGYSGFHVTGRWSKDFFGFDIFDFGIFISRSKDSRIREIFTRGILESWALEPGIQLKELGIPITTGILNVSSTDQESEI